MRSILSSAPACLKVIVTVRDVKPRLVEEADSLGIKVVRWEREIISSLISFIQNFPFLVPKNNLSTFPFLSHESFPFFVSLIISALSLSRPQNQSQNFPFLVPGSLRWRSLERCTSGRRCHPCQTRQPPSASPGGFNLKSPFVLVRTPNIDTIEAL